MDVVRDRESIHHATKGRPATGENDEVPALRLGPYLVNRAATEAEFEQIHRLNYEAFVREVPQHHDLGTGRLVDKFNDKNLYLISLKGDDLAGMIAAHDQPPFSVADRLPGPNPFDGPGERPLEVRLLTVRPSYRRGPVFLGLLGAPRALRGDTATPAC